MFSNVLRFCYFHTTGVSSSERLHPHSMRQRIVPSTVHLIACGGTIFVYSMTSLPNAHNRYARASMYLVFIAASMTTCGMFYVRPPSLSCAPACTVLSVTVRACHAHVFIATSAGARHCASDVQWCSTRQVHRQSAKWTANTRLAVRTIPRVFSRLIMNAERAVWI